MHKLLIGHECKTVPQCGWGGGQTESYCVSLKVSLICLSLQIRTFVISRISPVGKSRFSSFQQAICEEFKLRRS